MMELETRQAELEYECVVLGVTRYEKARTDNGETATAPGKEQVRRALPGLTQAIEDFLEVAATPGKAGRKHTALPYLAHILPEQAAYLTIRYVLDGAAEGHALTALAVRLGSALEDHVNLVNAAEQAPGLYRKVMEQVKQATSVRHREGVLRHVVRKYDLASLKWTPEDKVTIGTKLIELMADATGLVEVKVETVGRNHRRANVHLTPEAAEWFSQAHQRWSSSAPVHLPMVVPPRVWTTPFDGGYLTRAIRGAFMVQSHSRGYLDEVKNVEMPEVYAALNAVQATPWRINRRVYEAMQDAREAGPRYESLFVPADDILPVRPAGIATDVAIDSLPLDQKEALLTWKREASEVHAHNHRLAGKRIAMAKKLWVAEKFLDNDAIYFPHYMDFRGRIYPYANFLNVQADDTGRALLEFAEGRPLGERGLFWLKVHTANLFGIDKVSFEERVAWVNERLETLTSCVIDPLEWMERIGFEADSPWCALAAAYELAGAMVAGSDYVSHLPIAMDGSCSGLQHYSAMLRDPIGGAAVNLVPAAKPGDIYTEVAVKAQARVDSSHEEGAKAWKGGKVNRKIAKQPTMTLCYAATKFGMAEQIRKAIEDQGGEGFLPASENLRQSAIYMAGVVWDSIGEVVIAARSAMDFLKEVSRLASEAGLPIRWTAPNGFPVVQEYKQTFGKTVNVHYQGQRLQLVVQKDGDELDKRRQANGVAPNFVHSLDSAHLMGTVNLGEANGLTSWAVIHDSFGVHAADVDVLNACIREAFVEQYTPDVLSRFRDEIIRQLEVVRPDLVPEVPAVPAPGSLDLDAVRDSAYFFA